jgi:translocator assembly and maintenance protein 41
MTASTNPSNPSITDDDDDDQVIGQLASQTALSKIVETFPQEHLVHAFGYGSGVFSQTMLDHPNQQQPPPTTTNKGMLDMIFVVDNAYDFHNQNVNVYPHHYASWLRYSGPTMMARMQRQFLLKDAHVLFHVVDDPVPMKYGVVQMDDLIRDLTHWESLYLAGRLHKPTLPIPLPLPLVRTVPDELVQAQTTNLQAAVAAALLLLPSPSETTTIATDSPSPSSPSSSKDSVSWSTFYSQIAGLSYTGDFRMQVGGEDPLKISKLVQAPGQLERFQSLYQPILEPLQQAGILSSSNSSSNSSCRLEWNPNDAAARRHLTNQLPLSIRNTMAARQQHQPRHQPPPNVNANKDLAKVLASVVAPAARHQSFKGIFTLGFRRSLQYASAKLSKGRGN